MLKSQDTSDTLRENFHNVYGTHRINLPNLQKVILFKKKSKEKKERKINNMKTRQRIKNSQ